MASVVKPLQTHSRVEERRIKRDPIKPKARKPYFILSQQRRVGAYPASWIARWKVRQHGAPPQTSDQLPRGISESLILARKRIQKAAEEAEEESKLTLPRIIQAGPELMSVNRFYTSYTTHTNVFIFSRLPAYYTVDLSGASHVRHATHAVALLSASKSLRQPGLMLEARRYYCKAISTLNQALQDPAGVRDDANLVTLFLFGLYEVINGPRAENAVDLEENTYPHGAGGLELFKYRAEHGLTNEVDRGCFMYFCHAALMETFIQRDRLTPLWSVLEMLETPWGKGPILEPLVRRVVEFKRAFDHLTQAQSGKSKLAQIPPKDLIELLQDGANLNEDLSAAVTFLGFSRVSTCSGRQQNVFNGLFTLSDPMSCAIARSHYRALRIYLLERLIELLTILKDGGGKVGTGVGPVPTWSDGVIVVEEIIDDMRTIFGLEGRGQVTLEGTAYRTMTMFWPVVMVRTSFFAGPQNGRWVAEKMLGLSSEAGFGLGLKAAAL